MVTKSKNCFLHVFPLPAYTGRKWTKGCHVRMQSATSSAGGTEHRRQATGLRMCYQKACSFLCQKTTPHHDNAISKVTWPKRPRDDGESLCHQQTAMVTWVSHATDRAGSKKDWSNPASPFILRSWWPPNLSDPVPFSRIISPLTLSGWSEI